MQILRARRLDFNGVGLAIKRKHGHRLNEPKRLSQNSKRFGITFTVINSCQHDVQIKHHRKILTDKVLDVRVLSPSKMRINSFDA